LAINRRRKLRKINHLSRHAGRFGIKFLFLFRFSFAEPKTATFFGRYLIEKYGRKGNAPRAIGSPGATQPVAPDGPALQAAISD
jgi:hypothetical protein